MGFEVNTVDTHCMVCSDRRTQMDKGNAWVACKIQKVSRMKSTKKNHAVKKEDTAAAALHVRYCGLVCPTQVVKRV